MQTSHQSLDSKQNIGSRWTTAQHRSHVEDANQKVQTLIIEHGAQLYEKLSSPFEKMGCVLYRPNKGLALREQLIERKPQLVLLTTAFPHRKGFETCAEIRQQSHVPLIVFTDFYHPDVIIRAYELGADAVIPSPFIINEVETRIMAVLRRSSKAYAQFRPAMLTIGKISLDDFSHVVRVDNRVVEVTPTDYRLLRYFMQNANQAISKDRILQLLWGNELHDGSNLVEVAIRRLRTKIEKEPSKPQYLLTVHRIGYKFIQPELSY